jgi:hypothetical protein
MKAKRIALLITGVIFILATLAVVGKIYLRRACASIFTADAVQVICYEVHEMLETDADVNDTEIDARIKYLVDASVIAIGLNQDGDPVDMYGNPFEVKYERTKDKISVTCVSFGPDGKQGTADDIIFAYDGQ